MAKFAGGFTVAATVRDSDGDGEVTLEIPTTATTTEHVHAAGANEADAVLAQEDPGLTDYQIRVYAGTDVGVGERGDGDGLLAEGTLVVLGSTETPTMTFEAPGGPATRVVAMLIVGGLFGLLVVGLLIDFSRP